MHYYYYYYYYYYYKLVYYDLIAASCYIETVEYTPCPGKKEARVF